MKMLIKSMVTLLLLSCLIFLLTDSIANADFKNKIYWVQGDPVLVNPGSNGVAGVLCEDGDIAIGGGFEAGNYFLYAIDSRPIWQGWSAMMYNTSTTQVGNFKAWVVCIDSKIQP